MSKVVVIGGGVAGMMAAIRASLKNEVILLEGNDKCGKKILLTGNGRCNYWNENISIDSYHTDNLKKLEEIISSSNQKEVLTFLEKMGLFPRIKNGYYYPFSNQASSVRNLLTRELEKRNVEVVYQKVKHISKQEHYFLIDTSKQTFVSDYVILATGSMASPKTGSDGSGYLLAKSLGHTVSEITPALVPMKAKESCLKDWEGVRTDSKVSLIVEKKKVAEELGEIQLTNYGISGICVFNLSGLASKNLKLGKKVEVEINFLPFLNVSFYEWFSERNQRIPNHSVEDLLESIFPYKLLLVLLKKAGINRNDYWNRLPEDKKEKLSSLVSNFPLEITDVESFDRAQVATGGVPLNEINPNTMESLLCSGCYLTGELLDVDGKCGGFNIAFAFMSGYLAGRSVVDAKN